MEQGNRFTVPIHLHGTLAANAQGAFLVPCACSLVMVTACGSNANDALLIVGKGGANGDADGYCTSEGIGDSSAPKIIPLDGALVTEATPPHLGAATIVTWGLDFDGAGGAAAADVDILFAFTEG